MLLPLPLLLVMLRDPPLWPLPKGDIILGFGTTPLAPSHPRPARRALPAKTTRTSGPGESSTSRSRVLPSPPYQGITGAPDLSPGSIIRRPYFPCDPILGNVSCRDRDFHGDVYYDLPAFATDSRLQESMLVIQRYHLKPFMVSC